MEKHSLTGTFLKGFSTSWKGMRLTFRHLWQSVRRRKIQGIQEAGYFSENSGLATVTYPYETVPVPDHGRYQLHNEIEDCIVCDKCAKICPVDCIEIEPIRSVGEFGKTSDGTSKRIYAAKFDIDMAKCCFCGLCTTVCPTECLTMTPEYDFSVFDLGKMNFGFGNLTEEEAEAKRKEWEGHQAQKNKEKESKPSSEQASESKPGPFRPKMRMPTPSSENTVSEPPKPILETPPAQSEESKPNLPPRPIRARPSIPAPPTKTDDIDG